ncbi:MAG: molybdopterin-dependent oxidoreductase [Planctomycetes bacterium]|nr:molybdopterin-dependent oxidoreductase [Planctomycetota bacterium]
MTDDALSRRDLLQVAGLGAGALALAGLARGQEPMPPFTGPGPNPHWSSVGPLVVLPQKAPLIQLTDRPVQLETPRHWFLEPITPNAAFFVRWHLDPHPTSVDLSRWRLAVEGHVERPLSLSLADLLRRDDRQEVVAVNQCSGNSRSRFQPRVPGAQWGNGAMGCARWTGVPLRALLRDAGVKAGAVQVQVEGLDRGQGPPELGSGRYLKSLDLEGDALDRALVAFGMNGEPLPLLNGFPARLVVPGLFSTYWVKALAHVRVLDRPDDGFWMARAYRVPLTPRGSTTPADAPGVSTAPISTMPVRSFIVAPDGATKLPVGLPVVVRGVAFSGRGAVTRVDVSTDGGATWTRAALGEDLGPYAFRTWSAPWTPPRPGRVTLCARAQDASGEVQVDAPVWNPGGYLWNQIERQEVVVGPAS